MKGLNGFKNLKFKSSNHSEIEAALSLLKTLGYSDCWSGFSVSRAVEYDGVCAWDDGVITEDWLKDEGFRSVTLEELKEMVGDCGVASTDKKHVNNKTLSSNYVTAWEQVFGETMVESVCDAIAKNKRCVNKLSVVKNTTNRIPFTLDRLLGCEVLFENRYQSSKGYITSVDNGCSVTLDCGGIVTLPNMSRLTFFTEDGDELTFDEYVQLYYPYG